jgi:TP901 family phage tail tape measure protein
MDTTSIFRILYVAEYSQAETAINQMQTRITQQEATIRKLSSAQGTVTQQTGQLGTAMGKTGIAIDNVNKVSSELPAHMNRVGASFGQMVISGLKWAIVFTVLYSAIRAIVGVVQDAIGTFVKLDQSLKDIASVGTVAGAGMEEALNMFRKAIVSYASDSRESITDISKSIYVLQQAGISASDSMSGFAAVMDLVTATMGNVTEVTEMVAGVYNTLSSNIEGATTAEEKFRAIADILAYTIQKEQVTIGQMVQGLSYIAPEASTLTDSFSDLATMVGFLNTHMLKGSKAGMLTSQALQQIVKNSEKLAQILGITFDPNKPINFLDTVGKIREAIGETAKLTFAQRGAIADIFQTRGARPILLMIQGWDELQAKIKAAQTESVGFAEAMKEIRMDTIESRAKELANSMRSWVSIFVEALRPANETADTLKRWSEELDKAIDKAEEWGLTIRWLSKQPLAARGQQFANWLFPDVTNVGGATPIEQTMTLADYLKSQKGSAKEVLDIRKQQVEYEKAIGEYVQEQNEFLTNQSKLAEDRLNFELKLVDIVLEHELSTMKIIGKTDEEIAQKRIEFLEATSNLRSSEEQVVEVVKARLQLEDAVLGKITEQKKAYEDQLQAIDKNAEAITILLESGAKGAEDVVKYLMGMLEFNKLSKEQQQMAMEIEPGMVGKEKVRQLLTERGLMPQEPQYPQPQYQPELPSGMFPFLPPSVIEGRPELVSRAEAIAKEIANITIQQKVESAINIGGVTIEVQPGMSAENLGNLVKEALERVYRDRQSIIKKLTDEGLSNYQTGQ